MEVFQPFFVSLNLPYSVKRGEVISIPVGVFNYLDEDFDVEVTLHNTDQELEFVQMANEVDAPSEYQLNFLVEKLSQFKKDRKKEKNKERKSNKYS